MPERDPSTGAPAPPNRPRDDAVRVIERWNADLAAGTCRCSVSRRIPQVRPHQLGQRRWERPVLAVQPLPLVAVRAFALVVHFVQMNPMCR
jgi:hypothetical protein